jgi:cytochrome c-type biogenesis protein CcmH
MLLFWTLAAAISGGAALLVLLRARAAERTSGPADPQLEVYRRQLAEIDDLAERGLLGPDEHKAAHAEAGRRLLAEARRGRPAAAAPAGAGRRWVLAAAVAAPLVALAGYLALGSPGFPDQPYRERLKGWLATSRVDPTRLSAPELAAVLELIVAQNPKDARPLVFLAQVEARQGDFAGAARHLQTAVGLAPGDAEAWALLGESLIDLGGGQIDEDSLAAFRQARALNPAAVEPHYFLGRAAIASGNAAAGLAEWRTAEGLMARDDPRLGSLQAEISQVAATGRLPAESAEPQTGAAGSGAQQAAFIQSMVDRLAARLKTQPDDPAGWARLIKAYGVLGETAKRDAAIAEARRQFKDRPDALKTALGAASP